jgi:hypothetical protein
VAVTKDKPTNCEMQGLKFFYISVLSLCRRSKSDFRSRLRQASSGHAEISNSFIAARQQLVEPRGMHRRVNEFNPGKLDGLRGGLRRSARRHGPPASHLVPEAKDIIRLAAGLLVTMTALVPRDAGFYCELFLAGEKERTRGDGDKTL